MFRLSDYTIPEDWIWSTTEAYAWKYPFRRVITETAGLLFGAGSIVGARLREGLSKRGSGKRRRVRMPYAVNDLQRVCGAGRAARPSNMPDRQARAIVHG